MSTTEAQRPLLPPFDKDSAKQKVRMAEDAWNGRDPNKISLAYSPDTQWRNRAEIFSGRKAIVEFLERKWYRAYGNENWEFDENGLMSLRIAGINDLRISKDERKYHWPMGRRPDDHPGLSDLGL